MTRKVRELLSDCSGAAAAEFALIIPVAILLVFSILHMSLMLYSTSRLHDATEAAARCAAVSPYLCPNVPTWAQGRYSGATAAAFAYRTTGTCSYNSSGVANGHVVTGSATYNFNAGVYQANIPLTATACFPA